MIFFQLVTGKMMEQGPVLVIMFQSQQIMVVKDLKGTVVEGDPVSTVILKSNNVVSKSDYFSLPEYFSYLGIIKLQRDSIFTPS